METREKIDNVLREIDIAVECIWKISINVFDEINPVILEVNDLIADILNRVDEFKAYEIDVPIDVVINQLHNMEEGLKYRDKILVADTLEYEIKPTILYYKDIVEAIENV